MTDDVLECPSPGDCDFSTTESSELTEHINSEHPGEYQHPKWPDNEAGRAARAADEKDEDDQAEE